LSPVDGVAEAVKVTAVVDTLDVRSVIVAEVSS